MSEGVETTVAASDIARIAGVGRAAVGNWRRRFPDFPEPVAGTASSPLYRLGDVERWLAEHGRGVDVSDLDRLWQRLRGSVDDLGLGELVGQVGVVALLFHREPGIWRRLAGVADLADALGSAVAAAVPELPEAFAIPPGPERIALVRELAEVVGVHGAAPTYEFLFDRLREAYARRLTATPDGLAEAVARLALVEGRSVLDPACGVGGLLVAVTAAGAGSVAGQDIDRVWTLLAGARLLLGGASAEITPGDSLADDRYAGRRFGAVVCNPPPGDRGWEHEQLAADRRWEFGLPPRTEPELAWLQHCLAHVEPGGRVVLVLPPAVAGRRAGRRIRANLLRAGVIRAVTSLVPPSGQPTDLWVLHGPDGELPAHVEFAIVTTTDDVPPDRDNIRRVPLLDLLDDEVDLTPHRHVRARPGGAGFAAVHDRLAAALRDTSTLLPNLHEADPARPLPMTTVGELAKVGALSVLQAPLGMPVEPPSTPGPALLLATDVAKQRGPTGRTTEWPGAVVLRAGDVVTAVMSGTEVVVITEGGAVLGPRLVALRPDPGRLDPHFLAGFLRAAGRPSGRPTTSGSRSEIRRVPVARLPLDAQRAHAESFRRLLAFEDGLQRWARDGADLVRLGFEGLASGRLDPEP